ncbi:unnamed protein product [Mytilus edulis]|uniref:Uncharacterized protein n=1 Tax=Mytilus edulis TaxID=6550 RepID=A0A8S3Q010_MYTED|nr:unnamed protein product [Mytilus edulis]
MDLRKTIPQCISPTTVRNMAAFVVIQICFLFMFMLGGVTCRFEVRDCEKKYSIIDFVLEEYNCKFRGDGLYTYEGVKDNIIIKKITFDRLTEKSFLFVDGDVDVVEIFGGGISCQSVRCTFKKTEIWINTLKCNSEESSTITTDKQPTTISPTSSSSSTSSVTVTTPNVKRTSRPATSNVESKTTGGADMNMCPTTPPMESTTVVCIHMEAESSSIGWVVGFVVSCIGTVAFITWEVVKLLMKRRRRQYMRRNVRQRAFSERMRESGGIEEIELTIP